MWKANGVSRHNLEVTQFLNENYQYYATGKNAPYKQIKLSNKLLNTESARKLMN